MFITKILSSQWLAKMYFRFEINLINPKSKNQNSKIISHLLIVISQSFQIYVSTLKKLQVLVCQFEIDGFRE
ncbi:hypothetical protein CK510_19010 [Brunnivagina elsteri CCALA 953]|uniref:Uncharacterized protein n=1 Tax=Brunnivagina elsteri CCALA 953 TaxID=987040 RepID=A0A2A2TFG6_9CYAN|nr:hypothetical protein CK510_19010 [Calothrix elsteri CCALA 953]